MAEWGMRAGAATEMAKEFKDIFEISGVPAFNQFYYFGVFIWKYLYRGYYKPWHTVVAPTVLDPLNKRDLERLNMGKAACQELSSLVWDEQCAVNVSQDTDTEERHPLGDFVSEVLRRNNFTTKMQEHIEQSLALGGGALKVWVDGKHDEDGSIVPGTETLRIGYCMADQFVPTAWDNAEVSEGVFISRMAKDGYYYTRLEWHKWDGETYWVTNEAFRAEKGSTAEPQDILGFRYPLSLCFPGIAEETSIQGLEHSLFTYYRTPVANNLDDNSPLGVSIYANALSTLHALDIAFDSFVREFRLGRKRIIVPVQAMRTVVDPETGMPRRYFDASDEVYEALATDDPEALKIRDDTVELRIDEHVAAINALLNVLCLQMGFSAGTFTFDRSERGGVKTATEVISENSKTYKTVKAVQTQVSTAIERLVAEIIDVASVYGLQYEGMDIAALAKPGWECKVTFDDSILQDRQTNINEGIALTGAGLMSKKTFLCDKMGMTEEQADIELERIREEQGINGNMLDLAVGMND